MARKLVKSEPTTMTPMQKLEELVPVYAKTKAVADEYKKTADEQNKKIKATFKEISDESQTVEIAGFVANYQKQERTSMNEEKMLETFKKHKKIKQAKDLGIIKTKEYIDFDALENALYNSRLSENLVDDLKGCEEIKIVEVLKVTNKKE